MDPIIPPGFASRHIGPAGADIQEMLKVVGCETLEQLMSEAIPAAIRKTDPMGLDEAVSEFDYLKHARRLASENRVFRSYIGMGYYNTITPAVIQRNLFENPGWYTQYTPYQAEISQGRLESLLNFQTLVTDLTALPLSNASLLDEATAAAEAMIMLYHAREPQQLGRNMFFVSEKIFPNTVDVLKTRAEPLGIGLAIGDHHRITGSETFFGAILQYPDNDGSIEDHRSWIENQTAAGIRVVVMTDLLALTLLKPPGEMGADICAGSAQRLGVPLGYGGPHAAFLSAKESYKRYMPGRIIGVSVDAKGSRAYRMSLQTREQHIKREKATSNICTAQALLANMAAMYAVYHGPDGLREIAEKIHSRTAALARGLRQLGLNTKNKHYFDTLRIVHPGSETFAELIRKESAQAGMNFRYYENGDVGVSLDETTQESDVAEILDVFAAASGRHRAASDLEKTITIPEALKRESAYLTHPVFNTCHSETQMMRYLKYLENKDLALNRSMISLGSCTMKLNAASQMMPVSFPEFAHIHPFAPVDQAAGYQALIRELEEMLCRITGFVACSLQPNSGAQGEYAGLAVIRAYHKKRNESHRNVALIPSSAHGTNPASAVMAGMKVVVVKCDESGNVDVDDLIEKAATHRNHLAAFMITYPSTHGVFEERIREICAIVHENGGLVYMDGANMNAQVGLTNPAAIGADVCHLNLHKTFAIPHGGGGPGMGPICVNEKLAPFLPSHSVIPTGGSEGITAVAAAPWGSTSILLISYGYIKMLGEEGVAMATRMAILNANYLKARLEPYFPVLYQGSAGRCAHEMILDMREFKKHGVEVEDIAKRLMDYGFHAPTVSFPVPGTMMVEPTESEDKAELDRFCDAMIRIRAEIQEVIDGTADRTDNVLKNAPHTAAEAVASSWNHTYSREKAVFPSAFVRESKFWPSVSRIDNTYGDRNLVCVCPPVDSYSTEPIGV